MVLYCCRDHQVAHFDSHKSLCKELKRATEKMVCEETILRNTPHDPRDPFTNGNPFETGVGHFWGLFETRTYMRARGDVLRVLESIGTRPALTAAVDNLMYSLTLCRSDNMGLRDLAPAMMLRIDKDQECYDFIKW